MCCGLLSARRTRRQEVTHLVICLGILTLLWHKCPSNVSAAARKAKISTTTAYDTRRANPEFSRRWLAALCEGYEHLEMELLHRLRTGEVKPAAGAKKGTRAFDNATAFRLLAAHRESAARQRAINYNQDSARILVSINAKLDKMRERKLLAASETVINAGE